MVAPDPIPRARSFSSSKQSKRLPPAGAGGERAHGQLWHIKKKEAEKHDSQNSILGLT
jgi:hypothetical protein